MVERVDAGQDDSQQGVPAALRQRPDLEAEAGAGAREERGPAEGDSLQLTGADAPPELLQVGPNRGGESPRPGPPQPAEGDVREVQLEDGITGPDGGAVAEREGRPAITGGAKE